MKNLILSPPWFKGLILLLGSCVFVELALRMFFGFGHLALYETSSQYEYALRPSQDFRRFGNDYYINEAGMRSGELKSGELRVLKFGDSVLNGGTATDQSDLASSLLESRLLDLKTNKTVRILNVSAGSWGPDNAFAWLMENGDFDAAVIVLVFSSHDWQDQMEFKDVVGRVPFYPAHEPLLAITDAVSWVYSRYFEKIPWNELPAISDAVLEVHPHNPGWERFINYTTSRNISFLVYHHAMLEEVERGAWTSEGAQLEALLSANGVQVVSGLESGLQPDDFRDEIHPAASGQRKIADALEPELNNILRHVP